jgi:hypothetical protein
MNIYQQLNLFQNHTERESAGLGNFSNEIIDYSILDAIQLIVTKNLSEQAQDPKMNCIFYEANNLIDQIKKPLEQIYFCKPSDRIQAIIDESIRILSQEPLQLPLNQHKHSKEHTLLAAIESIVDNCLKNQNKEFCKEYPKLLNKVITLKWALSGLEYASSDIGSAHDCQLKLVNKCGRMVLDDAQILFIKPSQEPITCNFPEIQKMARYIIESLGTGGLKTEYVEIENLETEHVETESLETGGLKTEHVEIENLETERMETESLVTEHVETESLETEYVETESLEANEKTVLLGDQKNQAEKVDLDDVKKESNILLLLDKISKFVKSIFQSLWEGVVSLSEFIKFSVKYFTDISVVSFNVIKEFTFFKECSNNHFHLLSFGAQPLPQNPQIIPQQIHYHHIHKHYHFHNANSQPNIGENNLLSPPITEVTA